MKKKTYNIRWYRADLSVAANVSIITTSDHNAKQFAEAQGKKNGCAHLRRDIYEGGRFVFEETPDKRM